MVPFAMFYLIYKYAGLVGKTPTIMERLSTLFTYIDMDGKYMARYYYSVFFMRRIVFSIILVVFDFNPTLQCCLLLLQSILMLSYLSYYKVYTKKSYLVVNILNEIALIIVICICFAFLDEEMSNPTAILIGEGYILFILVVVALNTLWIFFTLFLDIKQQR